MAYVITRNKRKHFKRRIPLDYRDQYPENVEFVQVSLKTDSEQIAQERAAAFNQLLEQHWKRLFSGNSVNSLEDLASIANSYGFDYKPAHEFTQDDIPEIINRLILLEKQKALPEKDVAALLGKEAKSVPLLSEILEEFFIFEEPNLSQKSDDQLRKWKNPRKLAVKNFILICEDKPIDEYTRDDILSFRTWWQERIFGEEGLGPNAANKNFAHLKALFVYASDNRKIDVDADSLFIRVRFREYESTRPAFETEYISSVLLNRADLNGMPDELIWFLFAMADTGARPGELFGLNPDNDDIRLDTDIPFIWIRPEDKKEIKTFQSKRQIPLVGSSLLAFQNMPNGFHCCSYKTADSLSTALHKELRARDLMPTEEHVVYSLRHSFEDRLTAAEPPEKVQAALMGHKYSRERYGDGPSLEQKKKWLDKIALNV